MQCSWNVFCAPIRTHRVQCLRNIHLKKTYLASFDFALALSFCVACSIFAFYCLPQPITFSFCETFAPFLSSLYSFTLCDFPISHLHIFFGRIADRICGRRSCTSAAIIINSISSRCFWQTITFVRIRRKYKASYFVCPIAWPDLQLYSCNVLYDRLCHTNAWPVVTTSKSLFCFGFFCCCAIRRWVNARFASRMDIII